MKISELDRRRVVARFFAVVAIGMVSVFLSGCLTTWVVKSNNREIQIFDVDRTPSDFPLHYQVDPGDVLMFRNHFGEDLILEFPDGAIIDEDEDPAKQGVQVFLRRGGKRKVTLTATPPEDDLGGGHLGFVVVFGAGHGGAKMVVEPPN